MMNALLHETELERSNIVANSTMNRERNLAGGNSYEREIGFNPVDFLRVQLTEHQQVSWLDLCCGRGRALIQAAESFHREQRDTRVHLIGLDLVPMFDSVPSHLNFLFLRQASLSEWRPNERFNLITCVHGLHYMGDKLQLIQKAALSLHSGGMFLAHLDFDDLRLSDQSSARRRIGRDLRQAGFEYQARRRLLRCKGNLDGAYLLSRFLDLYRYLGADDHAGPNYTGQPSVRSYYEISAVPKQRRKSVKVNS